MPYTQIFLMKKCEKLLHLQKLLTFFQLKYLWIRYIVLTRTVNILTTNKLVKRTVLWTTGPCCGMAVDKRGIQTNKFLISP